MKIPLHQIDAFTDRAFGGNPAAVMPLDRWPDDALLQAIALENNLSETAFLVADGPDFELRWFTPAHEVALCGHATLASAHVVLTRLQPGMDRVTFHTRKSGTLAVTRDGDWLEMDFPCLPPERKLAPEGAANALGASPVACLTADYAPGEGDWLFVFETAETVAGLAPDLAWVTDLGSRGAIVTAPGQDCDFVSRYFAPQHGIPEDPVTGSIHCILTPYWANRLGKTALFARQVSNRGGALRCTLAGTGPAARVQIPGHIGAVQEGVMTLPD